MLLSPHDLRRLGKSPWFAAGAGLILALILGAAILIHRAVVGPSSPDEVRLSLEDVQADFDQFEAIITHGHPLLFTDRAKLHAALAAQRALLRDGMSELAFLRVLAPASHATLCAHTRLSLSERGEAFLYRRARLLPLNARVADGRLFVYDTCSAVKLPPGAEVLAINGRSAAEILRLLAERLPAEGGNQTLVNRMCDYFFPYLYYTYLDASREFTVSYRTPAALEPRIAVLAGVEHAAFATPGNQRSPSELNHFAFTPGCAVLTIRSFNYYRDDERRRFREFIEDGFADIQKRRVASLILDLRDNGGGDPYCAASVFTHLIDRPAAYFSADTPMYPDLTQPLAPAAKRFAGRLFVLINGGCFSSTGHLCALLKYHQCGLFVGEETGGSYACTDASQTTTLARSKLRFRHSTTAFKAAVSGLPAGRGTTPDDLVAPTVDDDLQHRDAVMIRALELIKRPAADST